MNLSDVEGKCYQGPIADLGGYLPNLDKTDMNTDLIGNVLGSLGRGQSMRESPSVYKNVMVRMLQVRSKSRECPSPCCSPGPD